MYCAVFILESPQNQLKLNNSLCFDTTLFKSFQVYFSSLRLQLLEKGPYNII